MEIEDFNCPICDNLFDDISHIPRMLLKCGHTYCELCIKTKLKENKNLFICPEDNNIYDKIENIEEIPRNVTLLNLLKKTKLKKVMYNSENISKIKNTNIYNDNNLNNENMNKLKLLSLTNFSEMNFSFMSLNNKVIPVNNNILTITSDNKISNNLISEIDSINNSKESFVKNIQIPVNEFNLEYSISDGGNPNNYNQNEINNNLFCIIHKRKNEIICLDDKTKICTTCALFGNHKNHNLKSEEDLMNELFVKSEILIDYFEMIDNFTIKINDYENVDYKNHSEKLKIEAKEKECILKDKVSLFFKELRFLLKEKEKQLLQELTINFEDNINKKIDFFEKGIKPLKENIIKWKNEYN